MLRDAGFDEVVAVDRTDQVIIHFMFSLYLSYFCDTNIRASQAKIKFSFVLQFMKVLQMELNAVEKDKKEFIEDFSEVRITQSVYLIG